MINGKTAPRKSSLKTNAIKRWKITNIMIAKWFGYSSANSFNTSKAKKDMFYGVTKLIEHIENELNKQ